jgi:prepilin signal peptidase PulO-like enzyme (type II secretory pathway)
MSYVFWPLEWNSAGTVNFVVWLVMLTGFMALIVYDLKWMLLPNRIVFPLTLLGLLLALFNILSEGTLQSLYLTVLSVAVAGGIFYGLFQLSEGRWIGGGDVKLGVLIGLILGDPYLAFLVLFLASLLGTFVIAPGMVLKKFTAKTKIPFGPFLIVATIIVQLFGLSIIEWYKQKLLLDI